MIPAAILLAVAVVVLLKSIVIVPDGQTFVIERLGRQLRSANGGLTLLAPFIDRVAAKLPAETQPVRFDVQAIAHDNSTMRLTGSATYRIEDANKVHASVPDVTTAIATLLRTVLIAETGKRTVADVREESRAFRSDVVRAANVIAEPLGLKIVDVEVAR